MKGSQDGSWGLAQSHMSNEKKADYHGAIERWEQRHRPGTVMCFVQYKGVPLDQMPRVYLATPSEVGARLRDTAKGRGDTILYEHHVWGPRAVGHGSVEEIPAAWRFTEERVAEMLARRP